MSKPTYVRRRGRVYSEWPEGYVYFATFIEPRPVVKIGWSQNPAVRVIELGYQYATKFRIIDDIRILRGSRHWGVGYSSLEARIHRELASKRVDPWTLQFADRGEWYAVDPGEVPQLAATIRANAEREERAA